MSNGNLIICDPEEGYAQALAYYLMHKKEFGMEVQVYDRIEKVQEIADRTKIQILFVAAEYEAEERKKVPAEQREALVEVLSNDPRPRYQNKPDKIYGLAYGSNDIHFTVREKKLTVCDVTELKESFDKQNSI